MKIELTSDDDLYFHYMHTYKIYKYFSMNEDTFNESGDTNEWNIKFEEYPVTCLKVFNKLAD